MPDLTGDTVGAIVRNTFAARRFELGLSTKAAALLERAYQDAIGKVAASTALGAASLLKLQQELDALMKGTFSTISRLAAVELVDLGHVQGKAAEGVLQSSLRGVPIDISRGAASRALLKTVIGTEPIGGALLKDWFGSLGEQTAFKVRRQIQIGVIQNESIEQITRRLIGPGGLVKASRREVDAVVRTAVNDITTRSHLEVYKANSDVTTGYVYVATLDERTTDICISLDGKEFAYDDPDAKRPPQHFNCLPGDSLVLSRSRVSMVSKRWFDGDLIVVRTASGRELSCTPNHPVLTDEGWVAAGALDLGHNVVSDGGGEWEPGVTDDHEQVPAPIQNVAEAFFGAPEVCAVPVPTTAEDFHGDGMDGEVAVVGTDGLLALDGQASREEHVAESALGLGDARGLPSFTGFRSLAERGEGDVAPAARRVGGSRQVPNLGVTCPAHSRGLLLAAVPHVYAVFSEDADDDVRRASVSTCHARSADPALVELDDFTFRQLEALPVLRFEAVVDEYPANHLVGDASIPGDRLHGQPAAPAGHDCCSVHVRARAANRYSARLQPVGDRPDADAELARKIIGGSTGPVFLDQVVHIEREPFAGHVYNLQSESSFYVAGGVIVHNCRSTIAPLVDWKGLGIDTSELPEGTRPTKWLPGTTKLDAAGQLVGTPGQVPAHLTYGDWLLQQPKRLQGQILGPTRAKLFREGKITLKQLVDTENRALTIAELLKLVEKDAKLIAAGQAEKAVGAPHGLTAAGVRKQAGGVTPGSRVSLTTAEQLQIAEGVWKQTKAQKVVPSVAQIAGQYKIAKVRAAEIRLRVLGAFDDSLPDADVSKILAKQFAKPDLPPIGVKKLTGTLSSEQLDDFAHQLLAVDAGLVNTAHEISIGSGLSLTQARAVKKLARKLQKDAKDAAGKVLPTPLTQSAISKLAKEAAQDLGDSALDKAALQGFAAGKNVPDQQLDLLTAEVVDVTAGEAAQVKKIAREAVFGTPEGKLTADHLDIIADEGLPVGDIIEEMKKLQALKAKQQPVAPGAALTPDGISPPPPAAIQSAAVIDEADVLGAKVGAPTGTNVKGVSGVWEGPKGKFYVKQYDDPGQAYSEAIANRIYRDLGLEAPDSYLALSQGKVLHAARYIDDAQGTLAQVGLTKQRADDILDGFVADVLTVNRDAVGTGLDNIVLKGGKAIRVDQGAVFAYRAQGKPKPLGELPTLIDWDTLYTKNAWYRKVFDAAGVTGGDELGQRAIQQIDRALALEAKAGGWDAYVSQFDQVAEFAGLSFDRLTIVKALNERTKLLKAKRKELVATFGEPSATAAQQAVKAAAVPDTLDYQKIAQEIAEKEIATGKKLTTKQVAGEWGVPAHKMHGVKTSAGFKKKKLLAEQAAAAAPEPDGTLAGITNPALGTPAEVEQAARTVLKQWGTGDNVPSPFIAQAKAAATTAKGHANQLKGELGGSNLVETFGKAEKLGAGDIAEIDLSALATTRPTLSRQSVSSRIGEMIARLKAGDVVGDAMPVVIQLTDGTVYAANRFSDELAAGYRAVGLNKVKARVIDARHLIDEDVDRFGFLDSAYASKVQKAQLAAQKEKAAEHAKKLAAVKKQGPPDGLKQQVEGLLKSAPPEDWRGIELNEQTLTWELVPAPKGVKKDFTPKAHRVMPRKPIDEKDLRFTAIEDPVANDFIRRSRRGDNWVNRSSSPDYAKAAASRVNTAEADAFAADWKSTIGDYVSSTASTADKLQVPFDHWSGRWSGSSLDHDVAMAAMHYAIDAEFGIGPHSTNALNRAGTAARKGKALFERNQKVMRQLVRAYYEETQRVLKAEGIEFLTLFRGGGAAELAPGTREGIVAAIGGQPAASFSSRMSTHRRFGSRSLAVRVHRSEVFGTFLTGLGTQSESEWLVLGIRRPGVIWDHHVTATEARQTFRRLGIWDGG